MVADALGYLTLAAGEDYRNELVIKRSRFITVLRRIEHPDQAKELQSELRKEFYDARHHCLAVVFGPEQGVQRSNDDGEPSGTAGTPMLEALSKFSVQSSLTNDVQMRMSDACAIVVRYFGGVLLGAGGLVRAYSESVSQALQGAPLTRREKLALFTVRLPHSEAARVENELRTAGMTMTENSYEPQYTVLGLALPSNTTSISSAKALLAHLSQGTAELVSVGSNWVDVPL